MTKSAAILLRLFILRFVVSALVVRSNSISSNINNRKNRAVPSHLSAAKETQFKEAPQAIIDNAGVSNSTKTRKMKSNNLRWAIHGVATELFHNIVLRTFSRVLTPFFGSKQRRLGIKNSQRFRQSPKHEIAVVTGATGGIGSQIAHDLAFRGYDVVIAARDAARGKKLVKEIQGVLKAIPVKEGGNSSGEGELPIISFVQYNADIPQSALDVASSLKDLESPLSVLINNAGIMGKSKKLTMKVNLIGPAMLTFALVPLMTKAATDGRCMSPPTVINVGSSAHLRATESFSLGEVCGSNESWINSLPDTADDDLSTYAQSKLALMQFSTLFRHWLPKCNPPIQIVDAHPGLVWTPLLRNHIGDKAVGFLTKTSLAHLIYKSSSEGAQAIVSALDSAPLTAKIEEQVYFVNGQPGGYAASESISIDASLQLWKHVIEPEVEGFEIPTWWGLDTKESSSVKS